MYFNSNPHPLPPLAFSIKKKLNQNYVYHCHYKKKSQAKSLKSKN